MGLFRRRAEAVEPGPEPAPRRDWADLPPMPQLGGGLQPTVDTRFDQHLATWQSPAVTHQLDHAVRADGPRGVVQMSARSAPRFAPQATFAETETSPDVTPEPGPSAHRP